MMNMKLLAVITPPYIYQYRNFVVSHVLTVNIQINDAVVNYIIRLSIVVDSDLRIVLLIWVDLSYYRLTVPSIGSGRGVGQSRTARDSSCDEENQDFFQLHRLLSSFTKLDHVANFSDLTQRDNLLCG